ncbi:hypothetical protein [Nocardia miyunensis]|uniref:hypothetical protein n=1 Tax=Nocardia miyunensis TaxID=282684 RepID=UPI0012F4AF81|nr:hypothetical protein [Nocardia miyunensis]
MRGRGERAPLRPEDLAALADLLEVHSAPTATAVFTAGQSSDEVWIVRQPQLPQVDAHELRNSGITLPASDTHGGRLGGASRPP